MTMDLNTQASGVQVVKFGIAERWILAAVGLVLVTALGYVGTKINKVDAIDTRTQVMQRDITSIQTNLVDLPTLRSNQIEIKATLKQVQKDGDAMRADINELQKLKGLR